MKKIIKAMMRPFARPLLERIRSIVREENTACAERAALQQAALQRRKAAAAYVRDGARIKRVESVSLEKEDAYYREKIKFYLKSARTFQKNYNAHDGAGKTEFPFRYKEIFSGLDRLGNVLIAQDDAGNERVFRGIRPERADFFKKLLSTGLLQAFAADGLFVKIKETSYFNDDYPLIVEAQRLVIIPTSTWSYSMLKEAAVNFLVMKYVLQSRGYTFLDAHGYNVGFQGSVPCFFDLGSVVEYSGEDVSKEEFESRMISPLLMQSVSTSALGRFTLHPPPLIMPPFYNAKHSLELEAVRKKFIAYHKLNSHACYNKVAKKVLLKKIFKPQYISVLFQPYWNEAETLWSKYSDKLWNTPSSSPPPPLRESYRLNKKALIRCKNRA